MLKNAFYYSVINNDIHRRLLPIWLALLYAVRDKKIPKDVYKALRNASFLPDPKSKPKYALEEIEHTSNEHGSTKLT